MVGAISVTDFMKLYSIGRTKTYAMIAAGELPARKIGGRTVLLRSDLAEWETKLERVRP